jgi:hypothetical protein
VGTVYTKTQTPVMRVGRSRRVAEPAGTGIRAVGERAAPRLGEFAQLLLDGCLRLLVRGGAHVDRFTSDKSHGLKLADRALRNAARDVAFSCDGWVGQLLARHGCGLCNQLSPSSQPRRAAAEWTERPSCGSGINARTAAI